MYFSIMTHFTLALTTFNTERITKLIHIKHVTALPKSTAPPANKTREREKKTQHETNDNDDDIHTYNREMREHFQLKDDIKRPPKTTAAAAAAVSEEMAIKLQCHHHHRRHHQDLKTNRKWKENKTPPLLCSLAVRDVSSKAGKGKLYKALINAICFTLHCDFFLLFFSHLSLSLSHSHPVHVCVHVYSVDFVSFPLLLVPSHSNANEQNGDDDYCKQHVPCFNSHSFHITHSLLYTRTPTHRTYSHFATISMYRNATAYTMVWLDCLNVFTVLTCLSHSHTHSLIHSPNEIWQTCTTQTQHFASHTSNRNFYCSLTGFSSTGNIPNILQKASSTISGLNEVNSCRFLAHSFDFHSFAGHKVFYIISCCTCGIFNWIC